MKKGKNEIKYVIITPLISGLILGSAFVLVADMFLPGDISSFYTDPAPKVDKQHTDAPPLKEQYSAKDSSELRHRGTKQSQLKDEDNVAQIVDHSKRDKNAQMRRLILLIIAITVHNFPEGLAVGVGYGSVGRHGVTIQQAHNLAIG